MRVRSGDRVSPFFFSPKTISVANFRCILSRFFSKFRTPASRAYAFAMKRSASREYRTCRFSRPLRSRLRGTRYFFAISSFSVSI